MQGKASPAHLKELAKSEPDKYGYAVDGDKFAERDDVWIFFSSRKARKMSVSGPLTVGYGFPPGVKFGPEIGFGKIVGDAIDEPVVLVKACWGGQSLAVDFRPPSRGKWDREFNRDDGKSYKPATVGWAYKQIFNIKHKALDDIGKSFPALAGRDYEIAGLVWFQGWNDGGKRSAEYADNLEAFIKDIRKHLEVPNLPIVVGVMGHGGEARKDRKDARREAQTKVAEKPEFKGNVASVQTWPFWDEGKHGDGGYHYNGSARFFVQAGEAFGKAMLGLLGKRPAKSEAKADQ
jgi:alpha-galactosidase